MTLPRLSQWFGRSLGLTDINPAIRRLIHNSFLIDKAGALTPQRKSQAPVTRSYGAIIRMVGDDFARSLADPPPSLLDLLNKDD